MGSTACEVGSVALCTVRVHSVKFSSVQKMKTKKKKSKPAGEDSSGRAELGEPRVYTEV